MSTEAAWPVPLPGTDWKRTFRRRLLAWYRRHARDLPWRRTRDPYAVWVSEIMLQQTQVATVESYFPRFMAALPTIQTLAAAGEDDVLRLWEGLGYYRRARQMHAAARKIVSDFAGEFPRQTDDVRGLPGIGRYTAGAILSIAFDAREPIVEANTLRLLARLLAFREDPLGGSGQRLLWHFAEDLLPQRDSGAFNQALMELGSMVCTPRQPRCEACPVAELCPTRLQGLQEVIPRPRRTAADRSGDRGLHRRQARRAGAVGAPRRRWALGRAVGLSTLCRSGSRRCVARTVPARSASYAIRH